MCVRFFPQSQKLREHYFSKLKLVCFFLVVLITNWIPNPTYAAAPDQSFQQEIIEQIFKHSLAKIKQLIPHELQPTCFISHVCEDDEWGGRIKDYLQRVGVRTIYDTDDLRGGDDIPDFIRQIDSANFVMTLFSPGYLKNYEEPEEKKTWIWREVELIHERLKSDQSFHIRVLLSGPRDHSIPDYFGYRNRDRDRNDDITIHPELSEMFKQLQDWKRILDFPITKGEKNLTDLDECYEFLFRVSKEKFFRKIFGMGAQFEAEFNQIKHKFSERKNKFQSLFRQPLYLSTELQSITGFFPQSLKAPYNTFLERTDSEGLSYLDVIFEELFANENESRFSSLTLCARNRAGFGLSGMGGVGKTTLATEFAHKYKSFYDLIFWMDGSNQEILKRSFLSLLEFLGVSQKEDLDFSKIIEHVNQFLPRRQRHWLLIIDNMEDPNLTSNLAPVNGQILYTSRRNDWLKKIDIDVLKPDEGADLLMQLTGLNNALLRDQALDLAQELDYLPLALAQAAAYIKRQELGTFAAYIDHYRINQERLLQEGQIQPNLNRREAVVMTTWDITMQRVSRVSKKLMSYFSYLDSEHIPLEIFSSMEGLEREDLERAAEELAQYSMIKKREGTASVHQLVQLVERSKQERNSTSYQETFSELFQCGKNFYDRLYTYDDQNTVYKNISESLPHFTSLMKHIGRLRDSFNLEVKFVGLKRMLKLLSYRAKDFIYFSANENPVFSQAEILLQQDQGDVDRRWLEIERIVNPFRDQINIEDQVAMGSLMANLSPERVREIIELIGERLQIRRGWEYAKAIEIISGISSSERDQFIEHIRSLYNEIPLNNDEHIRLMEAMAQITDREERCSVIEAVQNALNSHMDGWERIMLVKFMAQLSPEIRQSAASISRHIFARQINEEVTFSQGVFLQIGIGMIEEFGKTLQTLINDKDGWGRSKLIKLIADLPSEQIDEFCESVLQDLLIPSDGLLFSNEEEPRPLPEEENVSSLIRNLQFMFPNKMDLKERFEIIKAFRGIESNEQRRKFIRVVQLVLGEMINPFDFVRTVATFVRGIDGLPRIIPVELINIYLSGFRSVLPPITRPLSRETFSRILPGIVKKEDCIAIRKVFANLPADYGRIIDCTRELFTDTMRGWERSILLKSTAKLPARLRGSIIEVLHNDVFSEDVNGWECAEVIEKVFLLPTCASECAFESLELD